MTYMLYSLTSGHTPKVSADNSTPQAAWISPTAMALKRISPITGAQSSPNLFDNIDCALVTYRLPASSAMGTGCFTETALGLLDSDSDIMIFNGTDEGLPIYGFSPHQVIAPWPEAEALIALDTVSTGGSYISLYKNPLANIQDQRDPLRRLTGKQLTAAPELPIKDKLGQKLVINSQSLAFSDGGSWLVAETLNGSFVRINLTSLEIKPFAPSYSTSGSPALLKSRLSISPDGHFVAIYNKDSVSLKVFDLTKCSGTSNNLQPENCASYDYLPFINNQITGLQSIMHVRFVNEGLISFEASSTSSSSGGIYLLAPADSIKSLIDYLGVGDSYTSGEGAFDYIAGTDTPENMCHLSIRSYPVLLTNDLFSSRGGHTVACSGAVINDISSTSDGYKGQVKNVLDFQHLKETNNLLLNSIMTNFVPGYVAQQRFIKYYQPRVLTVSVGGDDIGFGDILEKCVTPHVSVNLNDNDCFSTYEERLEILQLIDRTLGRWVTLFRQLRAIAPDSAIYVIGYPQIALDSGNCGLNVHLSKSELEFGTELITYLDQTIQKAAGQAGLTYVDVSQALAGYRLCETASYNVAVNGLTAGKDSGIFGIGLLGKESYHPNAQGQQLLEQTILSKTHNLTTITATPMSSPSSEKILSAPKSGRKISTRVPATHMSPKTATAGKAISVQLYGASAGLRSKTNYLVKLEGQNIGTIPSDSSGNIDGIATIPTDVKPGNHAIDLVGDGQTDVPVDVTQTIFVPANDIDADGDGTPNSSDSCPTVRNSGIDSDQDGIDDNCDGLIGQTPASPGTQLSAGVMTLSQSGNLPLSSGALVKSNTWADPLDKKLGSKTINPQSTSSKQIGSRPPKIDATKDFPNIKSPRADWLAWILAIFLIWLCLVVIGVYMEGFYNRKTTAA